MKTEKRKYVLVPARPTDDELDSIYAALSICTREKMTPVRRAIHNWLTDEGKRAKVNIDPIALTSKNFRRAMEMLDGDMKP